MAFFRGLAVTALLEGQAPNGGWGCPMARAASTWVVGASHSPPFRGSRGSGGALSAPGTGSFGTRGSGLEVAEAEASARFLPHHIMREAFWQCVKIAA